MTRIQSGEVPKPLCDLLARTSVAMTLADATTRDHPIVAANQPFYDLTHYTSEDVIGHNCRFLQPQDGNLPVRTRIRQFFTDHAIQQDRFVIPNVRRDGSEFLNLLYLAKIEQNGHVRYYLGSQFSMSESRGNAAALYDAALSEDIRSFSKIGGEAAAMILGNYEMVASSQALIARARLRD